MRKANIVIGANYGDEGKGTVVATKTKHAEGSVLNILTNGGAQRGHSILTKDGSITFHHFGSGTYHGADNYFSRYFILNPMQFVKEYEELIVKPKNIYRDYYCKWSTPYDSMANMLMEQAKGRHASCGMGIWNTIKRYKTRLGIPFDLFMSVNHEGQMNYLELVKHYYEEEIVVPDDFKNVWNSDVLKEHFTNDCKFFLEHTKVAKLNELKHDNLIFENGQGLLLCDTGKDTYDTTPSNTGILYSLELLKDIKDIDLIANYVTRPYATRHGDGLLFEQVISWGTLSKDVKEDRTNHYNEFQGDFRYGLLNAEWLKNRILDDSKGVKFEIELTHCDEMDREKEFKELFGGNKINTYDSPLIK